MPNTRSSVAVVHFTWSESIVMAETADEISRLPEVRKELQRATGEKHRQSVKACGTDKLLFVIYALILVGCATVYWLVGSKLIPPPQTTARMVERIVRGTALIVIVLAIARAISAYGLGRIEDAAVRFTLQRV